MFSRWGREAEDLVVRLEEEPSDGGRQLHARMVHALTRVAARDALQELTQVGLLPESVARAATTAVAPGTG